MRVSVVLHGTCVADGTSMVLGALVWSRAIRIGIRAIEVDVIGEMLVG